MGRSRPGIRALEPVRHPEFLGQFGDGRLVPVGFTAAQPVMDVSESDFEVPFGGQARKGVRQTRRIDPARNRDQQPLA